MPLYAVEEKLKTLNENYLQQAYLYIAFLAERQKEEYVESKNSVAVKMKALEDLQQFRGKLPADFDYKKELLEALDEKYGA